MPQLEPLYRVYRHPFKDSKTKLYICQSLREHGGLRARFSSFWQTSKTEREKLARRTRRHGGFSTIDQSLDAGFKLCFTKIEKVAEP